MNFGIHGLCTCIHWQTKLLCKSYVQNNERGISDSERESSQLDTLGKPKFIDGMQLEIDHHD